MDFDSSIRPAGDRRRAHSAPPDSNPADTLATARDEGAALLAAADLVLERTLSRDSRRFLAQGRQKGGQ